ncbi:MAG: DinB family protein [Acidobacteria bacterium]|nr:DinB family protein [Acidobacteriota bacterium]
MTIAPPESSEYAPYYGKYVSLVPGGDVLKTLAGQVEETLAFLRGLSESQSLARYQAGKWSIKEVAGHLSDTERVFGYRALRFARNDSTALSGFEQDDYVVQGGFDACPWGELIGEFEAVRRATLQLFRHLGPEAWQRRGVANNNEVSVRALAYIIAGHERHHVGIVRERYL